VSPATLELKALAHSRQVITHSNGGGKTTHNRSQVIMGSFDVGGRTVSVPYPVLPLAATSVLAIPVTEATVTGVSLRFDLWNLFDIVAGRVLPIQIPHADPTHAAVLAVVRRYVKEVRDLDLSNEDLTEWADAACRGWLVAVV